MASLIGALQTKGTKKKVAATSSSSSSSSSSIDNHKLWTEKYKPRSIKDVLVACHSKKVNELRDWLLHVTGTQMSTGGTSTSNSTDPRPKILVMGGCSGNGKSTMLELLCDELNIERAHWTFDMWESDFSSSSMFTSYSMRDSTPKLEQLDDFMTRSSYPTLSFAHCSLEGSHDGDSQLGKRHADGNVRRERSTTNNSNSASMKGRIVIIEDPPHIVGCSEQNQDIFMNRLLGFRVPVVILMSEEDARDDMHGCLNRYLPQKIIGKMNIVQLFCPQITELKVKKVLESIVKEEKIRRTDQISGIISDISESCLGDLRHAINHLQFMLGQNSMELKLPVSSQHSARDTSISSLHSVSKLLAARLDENGSMNIEPDLIIESSDFPPDIIISFLQSNCIKNLQRAASLSCHAIGLAGNSIDSCDRTIAHVADVFSDFSDIDTWWFRQYDGSKLIDHGDTTFPISYCTAVASRSCAIAKGFGETERQEEAKKSGLKAPLAPVYRPKILDGKQQIKNNKTNLLNLRNVLASYNASTSSSSVFSNLGDLRDLIVTELPYMSLFSQRMKVVANNDRDSRETTLIPYLPSSISARVLALNNSQFPSLHEQSKANSNRYWNNSGNDNTHLNQEVIEDIEDIEEFDD